MHSYSLEQLVTLSSLDNTFFPACEQFVLYVVCMRLHQEGWWSPSNVTDVDPVFFECGLTMTRGNRCRGGNDPDLVCRTGNRHNLCSECEDGYFEVSVVILESPCCSAFSTCTSADKVCTLSVGSC